MMKDDWLDRAKERLRTHGNQGGTVPFDRLKALGMINEQGEVTGHLHRWNAFLAITEVKRSADQRQIAIFRCLKPVFGMPGSTTIYISRDSMVAYLKDQKKIITAHRDNRLDMWIEDCDVRLSTDGFVVCGSAGDGQDDVGNLPEFQQSSSQL